MKIKAIGPNPSLLVTTKDGFIKEFYFSHNTGTRMVVIHNRKPRLTPEAQDLGYMTLEDAYKSDPREDIAAKGYQIYKDWNSAAKAGKAPRHHVKGPNGPRVCTAPFPDKYLPQEVIRRRAGTANVSEQVWEAPELDAPELDASGEMAKKPAPKKVKSA